jgi:putative phosphoesterase
MRLGEGMKIGIVSDSHGRVDTVLTALSLLLERGAELLIHCGDIDDAPAVRAFAGWTVHFVWGNCDADKPAMLSAMRDIGATLHPSFGHLELEGRRIAWTHGDDGRLFRELEHVDQYDYLFYGHTHVAEQHRTGRTLVVNPGALFRARVKTCGVLDLTAGAIESVVVW